MAKRKQGSVLMRDKIVELLRLKENGRTQVEIAHSVGVSRSAVQDYLRRTSAAGLSYAEAQSLSSEELQKRIGKKGKGHRIRNKQHLDFAKVARELRRKGVTRALLYKEELERGSYAGSYPVFCRLIQEHLKDTGVVLRREYKGGEYCFVDYAGVSVPICNERTRVVEFEAQIFVATLGASNYTYCEATKSQELLHFVGSHVRAVEFFGGVPRAFVPDNLKSGVVKINWYEPETTKTYGEFATHYGTTILPTRVRKPRDKAKVEKAVQQVEREILAPLRHTHFTSLAELNEAIKPLLAAHNQREMKSYRASRSTLFETLDKPALQPLPATGFSPGRWKMARVNMDYHVELERHYYSVPYVLAKKQVWIKATEFLVEIYHEDTLIAKHLHSSALHGFTTTEAHMPPKHREVKSWKAENFLSWAGGIGPHTHRVVELLLAECRFEEQAFRSILGIQRLSRCYPRESLEACAHEALSLGAVSCKRIRTLLLQHPTETTTPLTHDNLRGAADYH